MERVFICMLLLSIVGSVLTTVLLILKPVTKRLFGSGWQYYIWLSVLIVMIFPVKISLPEKYSAQSAEYTDVEQYNFIEKAEYTSDKPEKAEAAPITHAAVLKSKINLRVISVFCCIWFIGMMVFFGGGVISYLRFLSVIRKNSAEVFCPELKSHLMKNKINKRIKVKKTSFLNAPLMAGIFSPVLLLPDKTFCTDELNFILSHELMHYKRHDLWYKWFAFAVNAMHWFNPFIYAAVRQINEECEISCDLAVTKNMTEEDKTGYMNVIISLASSAIIRRRNNV